MERNQKTLRKPKKTKQTQKNNIWKLLVGPPHPQDLWNIVFFVVFVFFLFFFGFLDVFFCFVPIPPIPKTSGILFFLVFSMLLLVCAIPPHPQDL